MSQIIKSPKPRWLRWVINIVIFAVLFFLITSWQTRNLISSGTQAPGFDLKTIKGDQVQLKDFSGRRVIIYFWATWCPVCKNNISLLNWMYDFSYNSAQSDPVFLSIVLDGKNINQVKTIAKEKDIRFPVLLADETLARKYRLRSYPTTYFISANGQVSSQDSGFLTPMGAWWRGLWARMN